MTAKAYKEWKLDLKSAKKELKKAIAHVDDLNQRISQMQNYINSYEKKKVKPNE